MPHSIATTDHLYEPARAKPGVGCGARRCGLVVDKLLEGREDRFELIDCRGAAVLVQFEGLGVLESAALRLAIELDEQIAVPIGDRSVALFDALDQKGLAPRLVGRHVLARA